MFAHRIFVGVAVLCCLANVVFSQQNLIGFNIGTNATSADVVYNGEAVGNWQGGPLGPNDFDAMSWPPSAYYLWLDPATVQQETVNVTVQGTISGAVEFNLTETSVVLTKGGPFYVMSAQLLCSQEGRAIGALTITIVDPPNYSPISLVILKDCEYPLFNVGFRCEQGICPKVIDDNKVDPAWSYILGKNEEIPWFYIWLNGSTIPWAEFMVHVTNDFPMNVDQAFYLPYGDNATAFEIEGDHSTLDIDLTCQLNRLDSLINITVTIFPKYWDISYPNNTVSFQIGKRCGDLTGNPRVGFNIGTTDKGNDVVSNGLSQTKYKNFDSPFIINDFYAPFPLYLSLTAAEGYPADAVYNATFVEKSTEIASVTEQGKLTSFLNTLGGSEQIIVDFDCIQNGVEFVTFTVDIHDNLNEPFYDHAVVFFQKECVQPGFDVTFGGDNTPIYLNNIRKPWTYTSPASTLTDTFLIALNPKSDADQVNFVVDNFSYDRNYLTVGVLQAANTITSRGVFSQVTIYYDCVVDKPSTTEVSFQIDFGWALDINVAYTKQCDARSGSSGWNAAEIFFFVVFILLLAFFLFGSIYKYFIQKQRGWDIIPGITYYRKCCKCCPGSSARYTPQMDSDYVANTEEDHQTRHTNYGTTSYQPNL